MASLRLVARTFGQRVREKTQLFFSPRYLLYTNTLISMGMSATGDVLIQSYQSHKGYKRWDGWRTIKVGGTGLLVGPICHYWYLFLDWWLPGRAFRTVVKKLVVDQVVISPLVIGVYLVSLASLEDRPWSERWASVMEKAKSLYLMDLAVWPPAQVVNFFFLPTRFRVLYDNTISFGFDCYYSYVQFPLDEEEEEEKQKQEKESESLTVVAPDSTKRTSE